MDPDANDLAERIIQWKLTASASRINLPQDHSVDSTASVHTVVGGTTSGPTGELLLA